jgi:transposase
MTDSKNLFVVLAVVEAQLPISEAAQRFGGSPRWIRILLARYREGGLEAVDARSRRPHTIPHATDPQLVERVLHLRTHLRQAGLDAGAESIHDRLPADGRPSVSTIWRILKRQQKAPRSRRKDLAPPGTDSKRLHLRDVGNQTSPTAGSVMTPTSRSSPG